jgi:hypothetical protein
MVEAEVGNHRQAEIEARSRLGNRLISTGNLVHASVALVYPDHLRNYQENALRSELQRAQLEYVLFTVQADGETARFPPDGWLRGGITELALLLHRSSIPAWRVVELGNALQSSEGQIFTVSLNGAMISIYAHPESNVAKSEQSQQRAVL